MLPKYKYLITYRYSEIIHDLTVEFCNKFLSYLGDLSNLGNLPKNRTIDQMIQAARSGKQNIVEGVMDARTSKKMEIKLLGVAAASLSNLGDLGHLKEKPRLPDKPEVAANLLLTFCHITTYLLSRQITKAETQFLSGGGYTENLFKQRLAARSKLPK